MPRARSLKPGFFKNELLAEIDPLGRLLFEGMWCEADREGRLEDRPKRLKAEYLPYDDCDADELIQALADRGFVIRYEVEGCRYIQVTNFARHQNPHKAEKPSSIPAPHGTNNEQKPYKHGASTVQAWCSNNKTSEAVGLTPDSGLLTPEENTDPDGSVVDSGAADDLVGGAFAQSGPPPCPHQEIINLYHEYLPANPRIRDWTPARQEHLRCRWQEAPERQNIEYWRRFFELIATQCPFLTGQREGRNGRAFRPGLEWMVKKENFTKIREGRYVEEQAA